MSQLEQFSLKRRHRWNEICKRMVTTQDYPRLSFTARGMTFNFKNKEDYLRGLENLLRVEGRREAAQGYITEEMILDADTQHQYDLFLDYQARREDPNERIIDDVDPKHRE